MVIGTSAQENKDKFAFAEFTHGAYKGYISKLKALGFEFSFYHNFNREAKFALYRHDVDFSPMRALKLAKIEAEMGVFSTFFIQPHCRFYHLLEKRVFDCFMEIKEMGHELALHFDHAFYPNLIQENIEKTLLTEKQLIDSFFHCDINVFSFHNPSKWALEWGVDSCAGMVNTYSKFFMKNVQYGSDSNGIWRNESFEDIIASDPSNLQLLSHPVWWTEEITSPKQRALSCIDGRAKENLESQLKVWEKWGREFIDW